jgi:hypothetical protein
VVAFLTPKSHPRPATRRYFHWERLLSQSCRTCSDSRTV